MAEVPLCLRTSGRGGRGGGGDIWGGRKYLGIYTEGKKFARKMSISVPFEQYIFHEHANGKNFLWVELHENYTAQNMLKSRGTLY